MSEEIAYKLVVQGDNLVCVAYQYPGGKPLFRETKKLETVALKQVEYIKPHEVQYGTGSPNLIRNGFKIEIHFRENKTNIIELFPLSSQDKPLRDNDYKVTYKFNHLGIEYHPTSEIDKAKFDPATTTPPQVEYIFREYKEREYSNDKITSLDEIE